MTPEDRQEAARAAATQWIKQFNETRKTPVYWDSLRTQALIANDRFVALRSVGMGRLDALFLAGQVFVPPHPQEPS